MAKVNGRVVFVSEYFNDTDDIIVKVGNYTDRIMCYRIDRQKGTLNFCLINTTKDDAGIYNTTANGTLAQLIVLDKPTTAKTFLNETGVVGTVNALLSCSSTSTSVPSRFEIKYTWKVNNTIISSNDKYKIHGGKNENLNIVVDRPEKFNYYTCAGSEQHGQSSEWSRARFVDPKRSPKMRVEPDKESYLLIENELATLECIVLDANPNIYSYSWFKGDSILTGQSSSKYTFVKPTRNDNGEYKCSVSNGIGNAAVGKKLIDVLYAPDTTHVIIQSPSGAIFSGDKVTLSCSVSGGNPLSILSWNCSGNNNNNTSENKASYSVDFTVDKTYNNKICTCSGSHRVTSYRPTVHHILFVYYAPDSTTTIKQTPEERIVPGNKVTVTDFTTHE